MTVYQRCDASSQARRTLIRTAGGHLHEVPVRKAILWLFSNLL